MILRILILGFVLAASGLGHEIPRDITVRMILRAVPGKMTIAVRVPLQAMRDVEFPEAGGGYLDVGKLLPLLGEVATQWVANSIELREGDRKLERPHVIATRLAVESDRSFENWKGEATGELGRVVWNQLWLDIWMETGIANPRGQFAVWPGMEKLGLKVLTVLQFESRLYELKGAAGWVELDPSWWGAWRRFSALGFWHILDGMDHLLFLLCLVLPAGSLWKLVGVVSAFTAGHSLTLIGSALGYAPEAMWFPAAVEFVIALSLVWMAIENITEVGGRWPVVAVFGLVHGFGFSFALRESLQFAGSHFMGSLVAFNLGVEAGQLLVVGLLWGVLKAVKINRVWIILISVLAGHTGWHWMLERIEILRKFWGN